MWFVIGSSIGDLSIPAALSALFVKVGYAAMPYANLVMGVCMLILLICGLKVSPKRATVVLRKGKVDSDEVQLLERTLQDFAE